MMESACLENNNSYEMYLSAPIKPLSFMNKTLHSVYDFLKIKKSDKKIQQFLNKWKHVPKKIWDSAGFQILSGRLRPDQLNPDIVLEKYEKLKEKNSIFIQLDHPPYLPESKKVRLDIIDKNVGYYFYMKEKNPKVVPVIHGWEEDELQYNLDKLNGISDSKQVAFGSNLALTKQKKPKVCLGSYLAMNKNDARTIPLKKVLDHIIASLKVLDDNVHEIIALGGGNVHFAHILFSQGVKATDGASWKRDAVYGRIYVPEKTAFSFFNGKRYTGRKPTDEDFKILKELHRDENHPYSHVPLKRFFNGLKMKKEDVRCDHNAYVLNRIEEQIANRFQDDPDKYEKYLLNRFESYPSKKYLTHFKYFLKRIRYPIIQNTLEIYLKQ